MKTPLVDAVLEQLFLEARTFNAFLSRPIEDVLLQRVYNLARMAPTSANCSPARLVFVKSAAAKAKLEPTLMEMNRVKTMAAPVTVIVGMDEAFYEHLPKLFPHTDAKSWFVGNQALIESTAFRNATLQGAYLILAARSLGLDCGPMSGFDNAMVDEVFFQGSTVKSNFLINLGYGDASRDLFPRGPRFEFAEVCRID